MTKERWPSPLAGRGTRLPPGPHCDETIPPVVQPSGRKPMGIRRERVAFCRSWGRREPTQAGRAGARLGASRPCRCGRAPSLAMRGSVGERPKLTKSGEARGPVCWCPAPGTGGGHQQTGAVRSRGGCGRHEPPQNAPSDHLRAPAARARAQSAPAQGGRATGARRTTTKSRDDGQPTHRVY